MVTPFRVHLPFATIRVSKDLRLRAEGFTASEGERSLSDLSAVLREPPPSKLPSETVLYRMYRSFMRPSDARTFKSRDVRHDITIMAPLKIGHESNKTLGHYHPPSPNGASYTEVYHVLHGKATYLLQREDRGAVVDFVMVSAGKGNALIIPPDYGHVTVNAGDAPLVMANLVSDKFTSAYGGYKEKGGAAYHLLTDGSLIPNGRYGKLPAPRTATPNFAVSKDLYSDFISCPGCFAFLNDPTRLGGLGKL